MRGVVERAQLHLARQQQRTPVGMPKTPALVDQEPDGTLVHGLASSSQPLERQTRRASGIDGKCADVSGERASYSLRPTVQRIGQTVGGLRGACEVRPLHAAGEAE